MLKCKESFIKHFDCYRTNYISYIHLLSLHKFWWHLSSTCWQGAWELLPPHPSVNWANSSGQDVKEIFLTSRNWAWCQAQVIEFKQISLIPGLDIKQNQMSWPDIYWSTLGKSATNPNCIFSSKATHRRIFYLLLLQLMHRTLQAAGICFRREWINPWHDLRIKVRARCWHWQIFNLGKREEKNNIIIKRCRVIPSVSVSWVLIISHIS